LLYLPLRSAVSLRRPVLLVEGAKYT